MRKPVLRSGPGWLIVLALAAGLSAPAGPAVAQDHEPAPGRGAVQTHKINELLARSWAENKIRPAARASDYEFLRRAYLDIIGRIATPAEVRHFELNRDRTKLIHRLLYEKVKVEGHEYDYPEEFARNWANIWTVWLMTRSANPVYREQLRGWLEDHFVKGGSHKEMVEKLLTANGKTDENPPVNYILRHIGEVQKDGGSHDEGVFDAIPVTSRTTRLFLGLQTQCVQCHDHPFNPEWKQASFWGVNVFFKQVDREPREPKMRKPNDPPPTLTLKDNPTANGEGTVSYEKRSGVVQLTTAVFLDGRKVDFEKDSRPRREVLADLVVTSPQFSKAYVNRIWGHLFSRGLNEHPAVDDFGEHNKVIHPELLDYLAAEFAGETPGFESGRSNAFDPKKLLYWICTSDAYGLSSVPNATNDKPEADVWFSRMLLKAMTPEQLFESLTLATEGVVQKESHEHTKRREEWLKKLVVNFGDDEGNEITFNGTLLQALMLMNGKDMAEAIKSKGTLPEAMKKGRSSPNRVIDELYLATLNRHPGGESSRIGRFKSNDPNFYADLMWALLNSNEFILNH